mgnify:CR=1 FL=1
MKEKKPEKRKCHLDSCLCLPPCKPLLNKPVDPKFKAHIRKLAEYFRKQFYCGEYSLTIEYAIDDKGKTPERRTAAEMLINPTYLDFTLTIYPVLYEKYQEKDAYGVAEAICHEIAHLLTEPLYRLAMWDVASSQVEHIEEVRERQTERIKNTVMLFVPYKEYAIIK